MELTELFELAVRLYNCPHGQGICPYHDNSDIDCADCIKYVIKQLKRELKKLKEEEKYYGINNLRA